MTGTINIGISRSAAAQSPDFAMAIKSVRLPDRNTTKILSFLIDMTIG